MPVPDIEQEGAVTSAGSYGGSMTVMEKMVTGLLTLLSSVFFIVLGVALRRKNKEQGTEEFVWSMSNRTIERLQKEVEALAQENNLIRAQKNQFETMASQAEARAQIASQAARVAQEAAQANAHELMRARRNWEKLRQYTYSLQDRMMRHNVEVPPEPTFE